MSTNIIVPALGESITEAVVAVLNKKVGDQVSKDEVIAELETDKVTVELYSPETGTIASLNVEKGQAVNIGHIIGTIDKGEAKTSSANPNTIPTQAPKTSDKTPTSSKPSIQDNKSSNERNPMPAAERFAAENNINLANVSGSGKGGQILKEDVINYKDPKEKDTFKPKGNEILSSAPLNKESNTGDDMVTRVKMSKLRQTIATRLKQAQETAAILTTFNEVDMHNVIELRNKYKENFEKRHGIKLGFMSFFAKATVTALKEFPAVNAEIDGTDLVYKNYYNIGVAVGTENGLVVPVVKNIDKMSLAEIEKQIAEYGKKAKENKLSIADLQNGTFTISNGGVYGSLLSTPILNPPQSGILGLHNIVQRPVAINNEVKIRPMMYIALSYDHRIIDGKEAVTFLVKIKQLIEDPQRLILDV